VPDSLWVAVLNISPAVRAKLNNADHRLDPDDVRAELVGVQGLRFKWRTDPGRVYVEIFMGDDRVLAVLYPVDHPMGDVYALGSAYREPRGLSGAG
jgi:hypothetical protein